MFKHQVMEDVREMNRVDMIKRSLMSGNCLSEDYTSILDYFYEKLKKAQCFHMGKVGLKNTLFMSFLNSINGSFNFMGRAAEDIKAPYATCWFDLTTDFTANPKKGILIDTLEPELITIQQAVFITECDGVVFNKWIIDPYIAICSINKPLMAHESVLYHAGQEGITFKPLPNCPNNISWRTASKEEGLLQINIKLEQAVILAMANFFLYLFGCKNIATETHLPSGKLNKKRAKNGKPPITKYKTLNIFLPGKKSRGNPSGNKSGVVMPLHLCRGHFKTYTKEKPLFGHITGRYWWQPHARGLKSEGTIIKNYNVKQAA